MSLCHYAAVQCLTRTVCLVSLESLLTTYAAGEHREDEQAQAQNNSLANARGKAPTALFVLVNLCCDIHHKTKRSNVWLIVKPLNCRFYL